MPGSRGPSLRRALRHVVGWRLAVCLLSVVPLGAFLYWQTEDWWATLAGSAAALFVVLTVLVVTAVDTARSAALQTRMLGPKGRVATDLTSLDQRVDALDAVISSETRRPWEPTLTPIVYVASVTPKPVLLLPGADYHLPEIFAIADELDRRKIPNIVAVGVPHWERTGDGLIWYDREVFEAPSADKIPEGFSAVVTMKDWAGYAPIIEAAKDAGIPTLAKVEGAQDFHDVDTKNPRRPYRTADHILCQGQNDYDALTEMTRTIVGSTRLERLWWAPPARPHKPLALINLNFTYGMLTDARDLWLSTAIEGCERAEIPYVISLHPAEKARKPHPRSTAVSASRLLRHATVLISRFSTLPYEAMARGVPFIYHNPHGEAVSTFKDDRGAFSTTTDSASLKSALNRLPEPGTDLRGTVEEFFMREVDVDSPKRSEARAVDVLVSTMEISQP